MEITPIHDDKTHKNMLARIEMLWDAEEGTPEHDELEIISILVDNYEKEQFPIDDPDPVQAVLFYMEQNGIAKSELGKILESRSRASEFLNRKKDLSISQIRKLHNEWQISADILIQPVNI